MNVVSVSPTEPKHLSETHHAINSQPVYRAEDAVPATLYVYAISGKSEWQQSSMP